MNFLKTTETGGHPLTLNDLGWIQGSVLQGLQFLINGIVGNKPCIIYGLEVIGPYNVGGSNFQSEITEGVYWDGNELLFHQYNFGVNNNSSNHTWKISRLEETLSPNVTFKNGQSKGVYKRGVCSSELDGATGTDVTTIARLDNELKSRLGINALTSQYNGLQNLVNNIVTNINNAWVSINGIDQQLTTHLTPGGGGHPWSDISNKPYSHGSAYLGDIGITSPAFPHTMGANCKRVAGTSTDSLYEVKLPNSATINGAYHVYGTIVGVKSGWSAGNYAGVLWNDCNDVSWAIVKKDPTQFHIAVRDLSADAQDLWFEFAVVDMSKV
jgi:hypothetical protein